MLPVLRLWYSVDIRLWLALESLLGFITGLRGSHWARLTEGHCPRCGRPFVSSSLNVKEPGPMAACGHCNRALSRRELRTVIGCGPR